MGGGGGVPPRNGVCEVLPTHGTQRPTRVPASRAPVRAHRLWCASVVAAKSFASCSTQSSFTGLGPLCFTGAMQRPRAAVLRTGSLLPATASRFTPGTGGCGLMRAMPGDWRFLGGGSVAWLLLWPLPVGGSVGRCEVSASLPCGLAPSPRLGCCLWLVKRALLIKQRARALPFCLRATATS
jgi:hypothetical protein